MSTTDLTTTSYAVLGLLAVREWSTYELVQQMERSLKVFWPRAQSRVYEEPKRLVALGLAWARAEQVGRRPRSVYGITDEGTAALEAWLGTPGAMPVLEFEALLKAFFSEHAAARGDVVANLEAVAAWAEEQALVNVAFARHYVETGGPFPERLAQIALTGVFRTRFVDAVGAWAAWALDEVRGWPAAGVPDPPWAELRAIAARGGAPPAGGRT